MKLTTWIGLGVRGVVAGVVGTAAMDALWYVRYRRADGDAGPLRWEFGGVEGWDDVSSPGQVGDLALTAVLGRRPPDRWAQPTQNLVHLSTGVGWGKLYALVTGARSTGRGMVAGGGPLLGLAAWLTAYMVLPIVGVYKPMWRYDAKTLGSDLGAHLMFGSVTGLTLALVGRQSRSGK
ncbi:MAG: hypothetical protein ACK5PP_17150 [Acidimicrobiales bacterium]